MSLVFHLLYRLSSCLVSRLVFLSPCVVVVCCGVLCLVCCVLCVVVCCCGAVAVWCVTLKNLPCVRSKCPRVYRHHAHMYKNMCAWCQYTRGHFERTHGGRGRGGQRDTPHRHSTQHTTTHKTQHTREHNTAYQNLPTQGYHVLQRFTKSKHWILNVFSLKNRSRTTCCRFLRSFAVPEGNKLSGT